MRRRLLIISISVGHKNAQNAQKKIRLNNAQVFLVPFVPLRG